MQTLWQDIRYAFRVFKKHPGFTAVAIIAIALGISANTTIFSSVDALLLRPFSFPNQDRLVMLHERNLEVGIKRGSVAPGNFTEWRKRNQTLQAMVAMTNRDLTFTAGDKPERFNGYSVSANFFDTLGVKAAMGRTFSDEDGEPGHENVVVLKHGFWQRRFGGDPNIVGKEVAINGKPFTVIGVTPREFNFPYGGCEMYVPKLFDREMEQDFGNHYLNVMGLLKPGVTVGQADADIRGIAGQLQQEHAGTNSGKSAFVNSMTADYTRGARLFMPILVVSVAFVLLIACANVANLLLVRASARQREIAVRMALGASRSRVIRQLLTESVLIALAGGLIGLGLSVWGVEALAGGVPQGMSKYIPGWDHLGVNREVFFFTLAISIVTGILFGLAPALQATKTDFNEALKDGGKGAGKPSRNRLRSVLVVAEVTLSLVLLIGAGLMVRSFIMVMRTDFGINPDNVISMWLALDERYSQQSQRVDFYRQLIGRIEALPNVTHAGAVNNLPMSGYGNSSNFQIVGQPPFSKARQPHADVRIATPGYFDAVGTKLRRGRFVANQDNEQTTPVVMVNEAFAARYLPGRDAVGQQMQIGDGKPMEIVGIVSNVMNDDIDDPAEPGIYLPYAQHAGNRMTLVVRAKSDPDQLVGAIRNEVATLDPNLPVSDVKTLHQAVNERISPKKVMMWMMGIFGLMALVMAAVGLYAVMSYVVAQRTHEIGLRIALGARSQDVLKLVISQGLLLVAIGLGIGLALAWLMARALTQVLYGVTATDPVTFVGVPLLLTIIALMACYIPARRAMKVDPMIALRCE